MAVAIWNGYIAWVYCLLGTKLSFHDGIMTWKHIPNYLKNPLVPSGFPTQRASEDWVPVDEISACTICEWWIVTWFNSLAPGKFEWNFRHVILKQILVIDGWGISCEIALVWMSLDFSDEQSTLVQVMAWCRQATSHYLSQCWPRSLSPYGVTRPQRVQDRVLGL